MRISDWSSDVCSSDLRTGRATCCGPQHFVLHLKELTHAGLVTVEQQGRNLIYRADFAQMNGLLGYLTEHCCQGGVCEVRSEERRVGKEWGSKCRSRWSP